MGNRKEVNWAGRYRSYTAALYWVYMFARPFGLAFQETPREALCYLNTDGVTHSSLGFNRNRGEAKMLHTRTNQKFAKHGNTNTHSAGESFHVFFVLFFGAIAGVEEARNREAGEDRGTLAARLFL